MPKRKSLLNYVAIAVKAVVALLLLLFFIRILFPFALAFLFASLFQPLVRCVEKRFRISRSVSSALIVTFIVALTASLVTALFLQLVHQTGSLISALPDALDTLNLRISQLTDSLTLYKSKMPVSLLNITDNLFFQFKEYSRALTQTLTQGAIDYAKRFAVSLPSIGLFLMMFLLGIFFFTKDYLLIINFFREILPDRFIGVSRRVKAILSRAFSSYMKAQLFLMLITTLIVTICLWVSGLPYPLVWGLVCGLVDALPLFGTAVILVPWALISLIYGDYYAFTALLIIQALTFTVRQLSEPKIVSKQIGIHPILTLISVYVGLKYFGVLGAVAAPMLTMLAVNLYVSYREGNI